MYRLLRSTFALLALLVSIPGAAHAQGIIPIGVELRAGLGLPQGEWTDRADLDHGFGYGFDLRVQVHPLVNIYGGWDRYTFDIKGVDGANAGNTGFHLGGQFTVPVAPVSGINPYGFAGVVANRTTTSVSGPSSLPVESDRGIGFEAGVGVAIPFAPSLSFAPQVRYRTHSSEFPRGETRETLTVSYLSFDVGLRMAL